MKMRLVLIHINQMGFHILRFGQCETFAHWRWPHSRHRHTGRMSSTWHFTIGHGWEMSSRWTGNISPKWWEQMVKTIGENDLSRSYQLVTICRGEVDWMKCACWMLMAKPQMCSAQLFMNIVFDKKLRYSIHLELPAAPKAIASGAPLPMITIWIIQT